jgi:hypothetical protein
MAGRGRSSGKGNENCGKETGRLTVENRTSRLRFGKLAAAFVALLLLGVMASSALADGTRSQRSTR